MIAFVQEVWGRFRSETGDGRRLRWVWASLAVVIVAVLYGVAWCLVAPVRLLVGYFARRDRCPDWLLRFGEPTGVTLGSVFFSTSGDPAAVHAEPRCDGERAHGAGCA